MNTAKFQNAQVGQTLNILYKGQEVTAIITHKSVLQIDVRFWNPIEKNQETYRSFTTNGKVRFLGNENSKLISFSL
jgi:hypothetical protein